jgi:hypothetical protein
MGVGEQVAQRKRASQREVVPSGRTFIFATVVCCYRAKYELDEPGRKRIVSKRVMRREMGGR